MKTLTINEKDIQVATTIDDLTLPKLIEYININGKTDDEIDNLINLLAVTTSLTVEEIEELDIQDFKDIAKEVNINDGLNNPYVKTINIDGIDYHSKANVEENKFSFTIKETKILKEFINRYKLGYVNYLAPLIFRVEGEELSIENIETKADKFKDIKLSILVPYILYLNKIIENENGK
jgi:hypothetical protein